MNTKKKKRKERMRQQAASYYNETSEQKVSEVFNKALPAVETEIDSVNLTEQPIIEMIVNKTLNVEDIISEENWKEEEEQDKPEEQIVEKVEEVEKRTQVKGFVSPQKEENKELENDIKLLPAFVVEGVACFYNPETGHASVYGVYPEVNPGLHVGLVTKGVTYKNRPNCHVYSAYQEIPTGTIKTFLELTAEELSLETKNVDMIHISWHMVIAKLMEVLDDVGADTFKTMCEALTWNQILEFHKNLKFIGTSKSGKNISFIFKIIENE